MATVETHGRQNISFQADWPKTLDPKIESCVWKVARVAWDVFSVIIFPIALCRLGIWLLKRHILSKVEANMGTAGHGSIPGTDRVALISPTGTKLDTVYFEGREKKAVIYFPGLGNTWQQCGKWMMQEHFEPLGAHVLMVNSRWHTRGNDFADEKGLALDSWTAFNYLVKEKGFDPDDILFMGHSMGGALATLGAGLVQEEYPEIEAKLISWNSFYSLASTVNQLISRKMKICCGIQGLAGHLAYWALRVDSNVDVSEALEKVKRKGVIWSKFDETIFFPAQAYHQAHSGYSFERQNENSWSEHDRGFTDDEKLALNALMRKLLQLPEDRAEKEAFDRYVQLIS